MSAEVAGDWTSQRHGAEFFRSHPARRDDLAIVEPQIRQPVQPEFEEMDLLPSALPKTVDAARGAQVGRCHTNLLGQFAAGGFVRSLAATQATTRKVPFIPVGRTNQQQRLTDIDSDQRPLVSPPTQTRAETNRWEA
jgi:hypothetical protein